MSTKVSTIAYASGASYVYRSTLPRLGATIAAAITAIAAIAPAVQAQSAPPAQAQSYTFNTLVNFNGTNGYYSQSEITLDSAGNLYGTTEGGGPQNAGTVFEIAAGTNTLTTLATFDSTDTGGYPVGNLIVDGSGNLYGTTSMDQGTVFEIVAGSGKVTTIGMFDGTDGYSPQTGLTMDSSGNLYGTTEEEGASGSSGDGTVFEIPGGTGGIADVANFTGTNGGEPLQGMVMDSSGNLYGTTSEHGPGGYGTVFEIAAGSGTITTLVSFNKTNGSNPSTGGLTIDSNGNIYGTTTGGGAYGYGTVWEYSTTTGTFTTLVSFNNTNGSQPGGTLALDGSGNLYGVTYGGGSNHYGTVYEIAAGSGAITTLVSFNGNNGEYPNGITRDSKGNLYGTTPQGGANGDGTVFELSPAVIANGPQAGF